MTEVVYTNGDGLIQRRPRERIFLDKKCPAGGRMEYVKNVMPPHGEK